MRNTALTSLALSCLPANSCERNEIRETAKGAAAAGCGYIIWYAALKQLSSTQAGIVQLSVPAIAAAGGVALLGETRSLWLLLAGSAILLGILITKLKVAPRAGDRSCTSNPDLET